MTRLMLIAIVAVAMLVHAALALQFARVTPFRQSGILLSQRDPATGGPQPVLDIGAPDERQHLNYVAHLAEGKGFPLFDPKAPDLAESYQSHQPPLAYAIYALLVGHPDGPMARFPSAIFGALMVAGCAAAGLWGSQVRGFAAGMALAVAPWPMLCALSGAVSNDPLLIALITWGFALLLRMANGRWTFGGAALFALVAGLGILTKTTAIVLLPVAGLAWILTPATNRRNSALAVALILPLLIAGPWLIRNLQLYGDPFALRVFNEAFVGSAQKSQIQGDGGAFAYWIHWVGWWTIRSIIGVFGYMDIWLNERGTPFSEGPNALYRVLFLAGNLAALAAAGLWRRPGLPEEARRFARIGFGFAGCVLVLFLLFNNRYFQAQGRYMLPAIAPLAATFVAGLGALLRGRWALAGAIVGAVLLGTSLYALDRLPGEFARRTTVSLP